MVDRDMPQERLQALPEALRPGFLQRWSSFAGSHPELTELILRNSVRLPELVRVWSLSDFVSRSCERYPDMFRDLLGSGDFDHPATADELARQMSGSLAEVSEPLALERVLRICRRRQMVRIAWRDLCGAATLEETLDALTTLAEVLTSAALEKLHQWQVNAHGEPVGSDGVVQRMAVLGMGKLGGRELNYSSDVDLIFVYPGPGDTHGRKPLPSEEFFRRLGQKLIRVLNEPTADGFVFRVDMRLRPFGDAGPLAMHLSAMEHYYQTHGREWERYATIKARPIAGDLALGWTLLDRLRPFVYRRYLDYGAIESLRGMKAMISREMERKGLRRNIKLGPGGIREIEFIAQAFQLIYGGRRPELRQRSLIAVLETLARDGDLPRPAIRNLADAYRFLRNTENRLQAHADRQTHELPADDVGKSRLAFAMDFSSWQEFSNSLIGHVRRVEEQFALLFSAPREEDAISAAPADFAALWSGGSWEESQELMLAQGYRDPDQVRTLLNHFKASFAYRSLTTSGRHRLDRLMPLLMGAVTQSDDPGQTLERVLKLVETVARRSTYLVLLVEKPVALAQLVKLCSVSPWISNYLCKHPLLLDELLTPATLYEPLKAKALERELDLLMRRVAGEDLDQQMDMLRHFQQINVLRVAAADVTGGMGLMVVSDCLTWIAETVLRKALELAWRDLVERFGKPGSEVDGAVVSPGFAIIAYGKLGGLELGYGSDLDLVFLHDSRGARQCTDGVRQLDNATFFARLAQRVIHIVSTRTSAGVLYEVDTRLRPSGRSGLLVSSIDSFTGYQDSHAWTWEHQALVRARMVAGSATIGEQFEAIRQRVLCRPRDRVALRAEVREMRERMRAELGTVSSGCFHLKQDPGGIADIEFMVQYEVLAGAQTRPSLVAWSDNIRQLDALYAAGILDQEDAELLRSAYRNLRRLLHHRTLEGKAELYPESAMSQDLLRLREGVVQLWRSRMETATRLEENPAADGGSYSG